MQEQLSSAPRPAKSVTREAPASVPIPAVIEVVELPDRQQRHLDALRLHIDDMLADQWRIASRNPLTLQRGDKLCHVLHGMLVSDDLV